MEKNLDWDITSNRFVAFFDIMGFKNIVERHTHTQVLERLTLLKRTLTDLAKIHENKKFDFVKDKLSQTKAITFSDSIIVFSKSDTVQDACKIMMDSLYIIQKSISINTGIKGAIAYGEITVDFNNSLFFGQPIIDAYLLHEQLNLYTAVLDNTFEKKVNEFSLPNPFKNLIVDYKANFKSGKIKHKLIRPDDQKKINAQISGLENMYTTVAGNPRIYIDNTLDFLNSLLEK